MALSLKETEERRERVGLGKERYRGHWFRSIKDAVFNRK